MTIALDATYSLGEELSGVGLYSHELLWGLAAAHPERRFQFCYRPHRYFRSWQSVLPGNARRMLLAEPLGPRSADLFHGLNQRLPAIPLRAAVATFHDLFVLTGEYSSAAFRARFTAQAREAAARADRMIAVSEFTRQQAIALLNVNPSQVRVVHHGIRPLPFPSTVRREKIVLNVGAMQTRKNIVRLVDAFEALDSSWRLVLAGSAGFGAAEILTRIKSSRCSGRIAVLGYVPAAELAGWYARARIFAFPSLDEGFGMPILEAMAAGVPVLTSDRSALPEVAGGAACLVDPLRTESLVDGLQSLARDEELRARLIERGYARIPQFSWEKAVRETWNVYGEMIDGLQG